MSKVSYQLIHLYVQYFVHVNNTRKWCLWWPIFLFPFSTGCWPCSSDFTGNY